MIKELKKVDGIPIYEVYIKNSKGLKAKIITWGATLAELWVPDAQGRLRNVVLGFSSVDEYLTQSLYAGVIVGRIAGRVSSPDLIIHGKSHRISQNHFTGHLHGGVKTMTYQPWILKASTMDSVTLSYRSPHGEEGYPGELSIDVIYTLTESQGIRIEYSATTTDSTPVSLTNHSYFNLAGEGTILDHSLQINASHYFVPDESFFHHGSRLALAGKPQDLSQLTLLRHFVQGIYQEHGDLYDLGKKQSIPRKVAEVYEPTSKIKMEVHTTEPTVQFYAGKFIPDSLKGSHDKPYGSFSGFCLECQGYPEGLRFPEWGSILLNPHEVYQQITEYRFK